MTAPKEPGRLLIADDNKVNRILLARAVEQLGHQISTVDNGLQALDALRGGNFDLMLLDIEMPEMDGYQVLETCVQDPNLRNIPIIMTTSLDELDSVVKCIELGAEDYLTKPVNPVLLRARVNACLEKKRLRDEQRKLFRTFATPQVAEQLLRDGFSLGGNYAIASIMFADIRSFTTFSEKHEPGEIIELLNEYFALMFDAITAHNGTVNLIQGDGLMAIFGAPVYHENHREQAVRAALEMIDLVEAFSAQRISEQKDPVRIGIGIATGKVVAGYTGTRHRASYTCVGDTVNLAARIEAHTKVAGCSILIDNYTRDGLPGTIGLDDLGEVLFKGKEQPIPIYSVTAG